MIEIGGRKVGWGHRPVISAELSLNHQGDLNLAIKMIEEAAEAGADAVKLQYFKTEDFQTDKEETTTYKQVDLETYGWPSKWKNNKVVELSIKGPISEAVTKEVTEPIFELFKHHEIDIEFVSACRARAKELGLIFGVTPTSVGGARDLVALGVDYLKIASDMALRTDIIDYAKEQRSNIPVIISTGHLDIVKIEPWSNTIWLSCVSEYPAKTPQLWKLVHMRYKINNVGYSDHTIGIESAVRATELGACWVECHVTSDKTLSGPDHWFSKDMNELKRICEAIG